MVTNGGTVTADVVVRAIEGWTPTLPGLGRVMVPVYSLMVATEPLGDDFWAGAGLGGRAAFADHRHMIIYGQRTADGRIAFGGRGRRTTTARPSAPPSTGLSGARLLRQTLAELFPDVADARFTHAWGGPSGFRVTGTRPSASTGHGLAWAGGYVGDGVSTTNLAGRTLADLITGADTALTRLPWVGHRSPRWEPEPLRWLGVNAGLWTMKLADRSETRRGRRAGWPAPWGDSSASIGATMPSVQETAAEAITKLIYTYAERIDAGDFAGVAEVFADATLTFEGFGDAVAGRDAIEALYMRTTRVTRTARRGRSTS